MGRKRTASYKRTRRAQNKAHIKSLREKPREHNCPRPRHVRFYKRRNQPCFDFTFTGELYEANQKTGVIANQKEISCKD